MFEDESIIRNYQIIPININSELKITLILKTYINLIYNTEVTTNFIDKLQNIVIIEINNLPFIYKLTKR